MSPRAALLLLALLLAAALPGRAGAHALEPGYLELAHAGGADWRITWRKPQVGGAPMAIEAVLPESCAPRRGPAPVFDGRAFRAVWIATCDGGLAGGRIHIEGLDRTQTDVLVRYSPAAGAPPRTMRLTAAAPAFVVPDDPGVLSVFGSYAALGLDHILSGTDHLLFVLVLLLLIRDRRTLVGAVTAFTVGHSVSLAAASLGWIVLPAAPVEAVIALSIAFLAAELLQPADGDARLTTRHPWIVAFGFGLLHGLGFARALLDIGLPEGDVPLALLAFNLGVEAGQLLFIAAVLALGALGARAWPAARAAFAPGAAGLRAAAYAAGSVAGIWVIERTMALVV